MRLGLIGKALQSSLKDIESLVRLPHHDVSAAQPRVIDKLFRILVQRSFVEFYGRVGGNVPGVEELLAKIEEHAGVAV